MSVRFIQILIKFNDENIRLALPWTWLFVGTRLKKENRTNDSCVWLVSIAFIVNKVAIFFVHFTWSSRQSIFDTCYPMLNLFVVGTVQFRIESYWIWMIDKCVQFLLYLHQTSTNMCIHNFCDRFNVSWISTSFLMRTTTSSFLFES
jgi:hypothetical protein